MRSCERPRKRSASEALPSSVSNRYSLSIRTHGSACRRRASSSPCRVSSFSASSSSIRAASHCSRVPVVCVVIVFLSLLRGSFSPAQLHNGKALHSVTVLPLLPHWEPCLGRPLYNQRRTERLSSP